MEKTLALILTAVLVLTGCGGAKESSNAPALEGEAAEESIPEGTVEKAAPEGEWERTGYFENANGDMLSITWMDLDEDTGWYVGCTVGEDSYGNMLPVEDGALHGDLVPDYEEGEFVVTVTPEGDDGVMMAVEGGKEYHFVPIEIPEAALTLTINTEGLGQFRFHAEGEEPEEESYSSMQYGLEEAEKCYIEAVETDPTWKFSKWTLNGEDYSTDMNIEVVVEEDADFVAVFEFDAEAQAEGEDNAGEAYPEDAGENESGYPSGALSIKDANILLNNVPVTPSYKSIEELEEAFSLKLTDTDGNKFETESLFKDGILSDENHSARVTIWFNNQKDDPEYSLAGAEERWEEGKNDYILTVNGLKIGDCEGEGCIDVLNKLLPQIGEPDEKTEYDDFTAYYWGDYDNGRIEAEEYSENWTIEMHFADTGRMLLISGDNMDITDAEGIDEIALVVEN